MERRGKLEMFGLQRHSDGRQIVAVRYTKQVLPETFVFRREIGALLGRIRSRLTRDAVSIIHVTSATPGEGVSTVARELVHAAAVMPWCRPLLVDRNPGSNDQGKWFGIELPDLVGSYGSRGHLSVAAIAAGGVVFHAAKISPDAIIDGDAMETRQELTLNGKAIPEPGRVPAVSTGAIADGSPVNANESLASPAEVMPLAYNLIIVDCPPVLHSSGFLLLAQQPAEVLLVVRAEHTHLSLVTEAKEQLAFSGSEISGVVMNQWRQRIPRLISKLL